MSRGFSGAASTSSTTSPSPATGSGRSPTSGKRPSSLISAALKAASLDLLPVAPALEDDPDLAVVLPRRLGRRALPLRHLRAHLRDEVLVEDLVDGSVRVAGVADVERVPPVDAVEDDVLAPRHRRVAAEPGRDVADGVRPRGEVVEPAVLERAGVLDLEVDQELPRHRLVTGELPDHVAAHHVLEPEAPVRACGNRRE